MTISVSELRLIAAGIWSTQLGLELEDASTDEVSHPVESGAMTASIQIAGSWEGAVQLRCSRGLIRRAASLMFGRAEEQLGPEDLRDALGELANVTAGNVKACLGHDASVSLPTVVEGRDYLVSVRRSRILEEVAFRHEGESLLVTVLVKR